MALPTIDQLTEEFTSYVNAKGDNQFVGKSVEKAVAYILEQVGVGPDGADVVDGYVTAGDVSVPMPDDTYTEEVMMLAADLFYRRQAQHGVITVNEMTGTPIRVAQDPYKACDARLARWQLGFA